jgi:hypothetical protein
MFKAAGLILRNNVTVNVVAIASYFSKKAATLRFFIYYFQILDELENRKCVILVGEKNLGKILTLKMEMKRIIICL